MYQFNHTKVDAIMSRLSVEILIYRSIGYKYGHYNSVVELTNRASIHISSFKPRHIKM